MQEKKKKIQSVEKHGRRWPSLIFLVIASPQNRMKLAYKARLNVLMDELGFYVPSTVFQSFRDDGRVNMKGSVQ